MKNGGIEDIQIGTSYKSTKKKSKKGILFLVLILAIIGAGIYYYFNLNKTVDSKSAFLKHLSNSNLKSIINEDIYTSLKKRIQTESSETQTSVNFSTTMENELLQDIDISKFTLDINNRNDVENSKSFSEIAINYSGNQVLGINLLSDDDKLAVVSDEIVNKYIGFHYNKIKDVLEKDYYLETLYNMKDSEFIELSNEEKQEILEKYYKLVFNQIAEDKFSVQENIIISKDSGDVNVSAYTLSLSQEELKEILINVLTELKNDDELLEKFITNNKENDKVVLDLQQSVDLTPVQENNETTENINVEENVEEVSEENNVNEEISQDETNLNEEIIQDENNINEETSNEEITNQELINDEIINTEDIEETEETEESFESLLLRIVLGRKINTTLESAQNKIDEVIEEIKNYNGNGIKIIVYASDEKTEKINITLPNEDTLEIEILTQTNTESNIDITYLYKGENSFLEKVSEKFEEYFIEENSEEQEQNSDQINGFKINIDKIQNSANTTLKIVYNFIENEKINKKISLNLKTDGTSTSKNISNDIVLTFSTNDGKNTKVVADNTINFKNVSEIESLTDENCFFLETLSKEDYDSLIVQIKDRIKVVYEEKKEQFNFIDTNLGSSVIKQKETNVTEE